tara:strand:- start:524 stop:1249 length:726 start_codon:yes stop_codon:yes gene_type:complete
MQRVKLDKFIARYNLGGNVESVKWTSDGNAIKTSFISSDKALLGNVEVDNFALEEGEVGVYQTAYLKSLLGVLGDNIDMKLTKAGDKAVSLNVKNGAVSIDYVLSDLSVIPDPPAMKKIPKFETKIKIDSKFMSTFVKGKGALAEVDKFTVVNNKKTGKLEVVIGYSSINTNRVNIPVETTESNLSKAVSFNANMFKEVLVANKECETAVLEVSNAGLARINFKVDDYTSTYYMVATKEVD